MPRPFRFQPPALGPAVVARPRLLERLAQRWDHRAVTVVAGPGFGKTVLLSAAMAAPGPRGGRDLWLSCEPADESAAHLTAGLAQALRLPAGADVDAVLEAVWADAPCEVCIVFDDVHEIPPDSEGAALLARLTTDLARNGHLVFASRDAVPVPLARLGASGQLVRVSEDDLTFTPAELRSLAAARHVDPALVEAAGGWPALTELTVSAGADMVLDYLWEEVLSGLGLERGALLARLGAAAGGDDEVASALAGRPVVIDEIVASVPLVERSSDGWAVLHPLWEPALRRLLADDDAAAARRLAAEVHRRNGRLSLAVDLLAEAEAWDGVLEIIRAAEGGSVRIPGGASAPTQEPVLPADFGRWWRMLPPGLRREPEACLATGLELQARAPKESLAMFEAAADGFRAKGDIDGELAAISHEGLVRWWLHDLAGLLALYGRVEELRASGAARAQALGAVGLAAVAHLQGDSAAVLAHLAVIGDGADPGWEAVAAWFRSVAHRRNGDLARAHEVLDHLVDPIGWLAPQREIARLRTWWLEGRVDEVVGRLPEFHNGYLESGDQYLARETALELAAKTAWLGDVDTARQLLAATNPILSDTPSPLARVLEVIARAAVAVAEGDEAGAAELLGEEVIDGAAALGRPEGWYWRDRAAIALVYVLVAGTRSRWEAEPMGKAHLPGLALARALEATRQGDLGVVGRLQWPEAGVVRAHLPLSWALELAAAGIAAKNPPPHELVAALGPRARSALSAMASASPNAAVAAAARRLANELPTIPPYRLRLGVLGSLVLWRDGEVIDHPELGRQRVRELLCYLVARRRVRREAAAEELWPDAADPGHNLRVTLNYLQRVLQPERGQGERPYFVRTAGAWLELALVDELEVDAWELDAQLAEADEAERDGAIAGALRAYAAALPLWRGEPFSDVPYALWTESARARLRTRYVTAAIRAGELWLAARAVDDARRAADGAIIADPTSEPAYRLLARSYLADGDRSSARSSLERCRTALTELGVEPDPTTAALVASLAR